MNSKIEEAQKLVVKDLQIEANDLVISKLEKLENWLTGEISLLINQDFQHLLNVLYRIDVNEEKVKLAMASTSPARAIAKLIIERELQKVASREQYRDKN